MWLAGGRHRLPLPPQQAQQQQNLHIAITPYVVGWLSLWSLRAAAANDNDDKDEIPRAAVDAVVGQPPRNGGGLRELVRDLEAHVNADDNIMDWEWLWNIWRGMAHSVDAWMECWASLPTPTQGNNNNNEGSSVADATVRRIAAQWQDLPFEVSGGLLFRQWRAAVMEGTTANNDDKNIMMNVQSDERPPLPPPSNQPDAWAHFLECLHSKERSGAVEALHAYLDQAVPVNNHSSNDLPEDEEDEPSSNHPTMRHGGAILMSLLHQTHGDGRLAQWAANEAVRVAQQSPDSHPSEAYALSWWDATHGTLDSHAPQAFGAQLARVQRALETMSVATASTISTDTPNSSQQRIAEWLQTALTDPPTDGHFALDPPTRLVVDEDGNNNSGISAMQELLERHSAVQMQVYHAHDDIPTAAIEASLLLTAHAPPDAHADPHDRTSRRRTAIETMAESCFVGMATAWNGVSDKDRNDGGAYGRALALVQQHEAPAPMTATRLAHEWAVRRGDRQDAQRLGRKLEASCSDLATSLAVDFQSAFRVSCLDGDWDQALRLYQRRVDRSHRHPRALLDLAVAHLDAGGGASTALPYLLECLGHPHQPGVHASARVQIARTLPPRRAAALIHAALPHLKQYAHGEHLGRAHLVLADGYEASRNWKAALRALRAARDQAFGPLHDTARLTEIAYRQARIYDVVNNVEARNKAARQFAALQQYQQLEPVGGDRGWDDFDCSRCTPGSVPAVPV